LLSLSSLTCSFIATKFILNLNWRHIRFIDTLYTFSSSYINI